MEAEAKRKRSEQLAADKRQTRSCAPNPILTLNPKTYDSRHPNFEYPTSNPQTMALQWMSSAARGLKPGPSTLKLKPGISPRSFYMQPTRGNPQPSPHCILLAPASPNRVPIVASNSCMQRRISYSCYGREQQENEKPGKKTEKHRSTRNNFLHQILTPGSQFAHLPG